MRDAEGYRSLFDEAGRYRSGDGVVDVAFRTRGGGRNPGKLHFADGLCVKAEMERGGDWHSPDGAPLDGLRLLLQFGEDAPTFVLIDNGRLFPYAEPRDDAAKADFLNKLRVARNLFAHGESGPEGQRPGAPARALWLTPRTVAGFSAADFGELGPHRQEQLGAAVRDFAEVAKEVPPHGPPSEEQYNKARASFTTVLQLLAPYLRVGEETTAVEEALRGVELPSWVVNWDCELGEDSRGAPAVWITVFVDEKAAPIKGLAVPLSDLSQKAHRALMASGSDRWPYLQVRTATEHKHYV